MIMKKCIKRRFDYKEAEKALQNCKTRKNVRKRPKQEVRIYKCYHCDAWHLTSISSKEWGQRMKLSQERQEKRIRREADFWTKKLGVEV
jgi:hypothetical protein